MAGGVSIGPRIQVDGEEQYRQQISNIIQQSKTLDAEMKALTASFGEEDSAQQRAAKSADLLNQQLEVAQKRTELVRGMTAEAIAAYGENSTQALKWREALASAKEEEAKLTRAIDENNKALVEQNEEVDTTANLFQNLDQTSRLLASQLTLLQEKYKGSEKSEEAVAAKSALLEKQLQNQSEKVTLLREALENSSKVYGDTAEETVKLQIQLNNAEAQEIKLSRAIEENSKALTEQNDEVGKSEEKMTGLGDTIDTVADKLGIHLPKSAKEALNGMEGFSAGSVAKLGAVAAAAAAVISTMKALHEMTLEAAEQADTLLTRSAKTGLDVELIQALDNASKYIDFDGIDQSLAKLTQTMDKARDGAKEQSEAFKMLGVAVINEDGSLRDNYSTFLDVIDALGDVENETERDVLANNLLGKSYQDLKPLIDAGSESLKQFTNEAKENGLVLTNDQVKKLGEVDDAHQKLQATVDVTQKKIAADYAPAVIAAMDLITEAVETAGDAFIESGLIANTAELIEKGATLLKTGTDLAQRIPDWMNPVKAASKDIELLNRTIEGTLDLLGLANKEMIGYGTVGSDVYGASWKSDVQAWVTAGGTIITPDIIDQIDKTTGKPKNSFYLGNLVPGDSVYSYGHMDEDEIQRLLAKIGRNAAGTDYWRGGATWLGEGGPEIVELPRGSVIHSSQESSQIAAAGKTDTRRMEQLQAEEIAIMRDIKSELAARRMLERMG